MAFQDTPSQNRFKEICFKCLREEPRTSSDYLLKEPMTFRDERCTYLELNKLYIHTEILRKSLIRDPVISLTLNHISPSKGLTDLSFTSLRKDTRASRDDFSIYVFKMGLTVSRNC